MNKFIHSAILCAGGISKRMGKRNKVLLPYQNTVVLAHAIKELTESRASQVIVVLGFEYLKARKAIEHFGDQIKIVKNEDYLSGQTSSIKAGLGHIAHDAGSFMICMADMPLLTSHHFNKLFDFYEQMSLKTEQLIVRPIVHKDPGHPVLMNISYREDVNNCHDKNGCRSVIKDAKKSFLPFDSNDIAFIKDIDTHDVYEELISNYSNK